MKLWIFSLLVVCMLTTGAQARPTLHCNNGSTITFKASVMWDSAHEEMPFVASFYANSGECVEIICADPNDSGDMWVTGPEGVSTRDQIPTSGNLVITIDPVADEGWHTFQMFTGDNVTENYSCTLQRANTGGC